LWAHTTIFERPTRRDSSSDNPSSDVDHVLVAQVPSGHATGEHGPVVRFCVLHHACVLLGGERVFAAVAMQTVGAERSLVHFHELADDLPFTGCFETEPVGRAAHESVHAVAIGPVSFDRDGMKTLLGDEALGSGRAGSVKLVRPVGSLAQ
jgi:hypothetical protein